MKIIGTSSKLAGYSHIYMLNGYSFSKDKSTVFKYMPMDRFINSVDNQELVFVSPETWYDPFEQLYFGIDCSSRGYHTEDIVCMCVSEKSSTNEDASWRVYAGSNNKTVRLSLEKDKLLVLLDDFASKNGFDVFIGRVNYSFEKKDIKGLHNSTSPYYKVYFPSVMNREHYLSLMLLKRKAFSYENEVRIFLIKNSIKEKLLRIPCNYKASGLVSNVMLSPYPPVRKNSDLAFNIREKINKIESEEIKTVLKEKVNCRIQQSLLYKVYPNVDKVE